MYKGRAFYDERTRCYYMENYLEPDDDDEPLMWVESNPVALDEVLRLQEESVITMGSIVREW